MGRKFHGVSGGRGELYGCRGCSTYITCHAELTSNAFNGSTGPATLFKKAWNVTHGEMGSREMTTGLHIVRDVFCCICNKKLGWMYELALVASQTYKEGQVILENANMVRIQPDIQDPVGEDDEEERPPSPNIEARPRRRSSSEKLFPSSSSSESSSSDLQK